MLDGVAAINRGAEDVVARGAESATDVRRAMSLNGRIYERLYRTHWAVPPDYFLIAERRGDVVATAGLLFAARHACIPSEAYFDLSESVAEFFTTERERLAEIGRLTSTSTAGLRAVLRAALGECLRRGIAYLVGWTSPPVREHLARSCRFQFQKLEARLNVERALQDRNWVTTPTGFFVRDDAPELLLSVLAVHPAASAEIGVPAAAGKPSRAASCR